MFPKIKALINSSEVLIGYSPLRDEISPTAIPCIENFDGLMVAVPNENFPNPFDYSVWLKKHCANQRTVILIPGQQFDLFGTRYGRGGGWYDRLLSQLPPRWWRIGITAEKNLTRSRLPRQPHDEPVDWLICRGDDDWSVFETKARTNLDSDPSVALSGLEDDHYI